MKQNKINWRNWGKNSPWYFNDVDLTSFYILAKVIAIIELGIIICSILGSVSVGPNHKYTINMSMEQEIGPLALFLSIPFLILACYLLYLITLHQTKTQSKIDIPKTYLKHDTISKNLIESLDKSDDWLPDAISKNLIELLDKLDNWLNDFKNLSNQVIISIFILGIMSIVFIIYVFNYFELFNILILIFVLLIMPLYWNWIQYNKKLKEISALKKHLRILKEQINKNQKVRHTSKE